MKKLKSGAKSDSVPSGLIQELSGYIDLGMKGQAIKLTLKILKKERIYPEEFAEAMKAIGALGTLAELRKWREIVDAAYARQSKKSKQAMGGDMLRYYYTAKDWESALNFLSEGEMRDAVNAVFIMDLLLENDRMKEAGHLARRCERLLAQKQDRFTLSLLIEALGSYCARIGDWEKAIYLWQCAPLEQPFRQNALGGIVEIHLARAWEAVRHGLVALDHLKKHPDQETALTVPGNDEGMTLDAERNLMRFQRGIEKLLPEMKRRKLGIKQT